MMKKQFEHWEKTKDIADQVIDLMVNYRQSGHPGGSRSKMHILLSLMLGGAMRWDIRNPLKRFADRFVLGAGHTIPLVYGVVAILNEAFRIRYEKTKDPIYKINTKPENTLYWEDILGFRFNGGLSGHAEMGGKTFFIKFNTGPTGHGTPAAAGEAVALKRAGAKGVRVFLLEGEGGLTAGVNHETMNSAYGLKLDNFHILLDWNDFGIDNHRTSDVVWGSPDDWFASHGWRVTRCHKVEAWAKIDEALMGLLEEDPECRPAACWVKSRKGRGYYKYDNASHGTPHPMNSELFLKTKEDFAKKYNVSFSFANEGELKEKADIQREFKENLEKVISVLREDNALVEYLTDCLVEIGDSVPDSIPTYQLGEKSPFDDPRLYDAEEYPEGLFAKPGEKAPNRVGLAKWGAWVNAFGAKEYGRPLFLASSADLSDSTNISGFGKDWEDFGGYGWFGRPGDDNGVMLPQEITEFANAGISVGAASVNFAENPFKDFNGFWCATSTYGSFAYLFYGMMRLYSQMDQDCETKLGKVVMVAGHSGPETADDSRTHFGVFSPGVTQLFPEGRVINLHPWEHNEVPVLMAKALSEDVAVVVLHLTRPPVMIPDREAKKIPSHFEAARGAYILRDSDSSRPVDGTFYVQGTSAVAGVIDLLEHIDKAGWNVKIVCITSTELFNRQSEEYRSTVVAPADRLNSTVVTTQSRKLLPQWNFNPLSDQYAISADHDNRWRTGGTLSEVLEEAKLNSDSIYTGIKRFVESKGERLAQINSLFHEN